jgi:hypothetical protein
MLPGKEYTMKIIILSIGFLLFFLLLIRGMVGSLDHNTYVIGGEYTLHKDEIVQGKLHLFFAQATIEKGSHIEGDISSFSSSIDICGSVTGNISSMESDIQFDKTADFRGLVQDKDVLPFVILLPKMARWNLSSEYR